MKADQSPAGIPRRHSGNADMAVRRRFNCSPEQVFPYCMTAGHIRVGVVLRGCAMSTPAGPHRHQAAPLLRHVATAHRRHHRGHRDRTQPAPGSGSSRLLVSKARVEITVNATANGSLVSIAETSQTPLRQLVPQPGTSGRHRRTQPQDAASARLPRRRPHVSGSARPKRRRTPVGRTPT